MKFNDFNGESLCGIRIGMMFYFYQDPNRVKNIIKELFEEFCDMAQPNFKYYNYGTPTLKKLKIDGIQYFNKVIDESDFNQTCSLGLTDATRDTLQNVKMQIMFRTIKDEYLSKTPNMIYFEFTPQVCCEQAIHFIRRSFYSMTYHYACCNFVMGINDHLVPNSGSQAMRILRTTNTLNSSYSILANPSFLKEIDKGIDGPNLIQVLSEKLYEKVGFKSILDENKKGYLNYELGEDYILLSLLQDGWTQNDEELFEKFKSLYNLLKPILVEINKPQMYWKQEEWEKWRKRFD